MIFFVFFGFYVYCVFEKQQKIGQKKHAKKNDNFSLFAKHRLIKKNRYVATPLIQRGEALAIFERDLIIHFQQISRAAALYIWALLGGIKRTLLRYTEGWMKPLRTTLGRSRPQKRSGIHMQKVFWWWHWQLWTFLQRHGKALACWGQFPTVV